MNKVCYMDFIQDDISTVNHMSSHIHKGTGGSNQDRRN